MILLLSWESSGAWERQLSAMQVIGIDLGTTNSLVSCFTDDGPELIPNALGEFLTPSAIGLSKAGDLLIGPKIFLLFCWAV
jgi:molecular chaperone DnaK (HSP70)